MLKMSKNVLVIGAGVDKTAGINMPLANQLVPEIARFSENEGKEIDKLIKSLLPNLRFSFNRFIKEAIDSLTKVDENYVKNLKERLKNEIAKVDDEKNKKLGTLLIKLFDKLIQIQEGGKLDDETFDLIKEVFGEKTQKEMEDESIIEFDKISFSDSFKTVMKKVLKQSLSLDNQENPIYNIVSSKLLDIETLLVETFLGFYNEKLSDIKKYLYISWMLWAYLKTKENEVLSNSKGSIPFYSSIPKEWKVISFNYTSFLTKVLDKENHIYFHGALNQYLRMDLRDLIPIEESSVENIKYFLEKVIQPNINLEEQKYVIPGIIPPLRLKPVLSNRFIETWYNASEWIRRSKNIIVIGYSFNYADEHFNDIIRNNREKNIYIINPSADKLKYELSKIIGFREGDYTEMEIQGKTSYKCGKIRLLKAKADEIKLSELCVS